MNLHTCPTLSDHKQEKIANVSASAPQLINRHSPHPPSSQSPAKPSQYQSLQSNQKTPPIPKKRTKFLKAIGDGAPKPYIAPIEADDSPSLSEKPLSPQKQSAAIASASPGSSHHKPAQPSVPAVGHMQNRKCICALIVFIFQYITCGLSTSTATYTTVLTVLSLVCQ